MKLLLTPLLLFAAATPAPVPDTPAPVLNVPAKEQFGNARYKTKAYVPAANGMAMLDAALEKSAAAKRNLVVVLGANWCHDSAALANDIGTEPLREIFATQMDVVFIDVGKPKIPGKGRNLDIPKRFGIETLAGTPTVMILSPDGKMLNSVDDAKSWRNAASRKSDALLAYFTKAAQKR